MMLSSEEAGGMLEELGARVGISKSHVLNVSRTPIVFTSTFLSQACQERSYDLFRFLH